MANKKRLKKEIKELRKRVKKATERNLKAQEELSLLQKRIARRDAGATAASGQSIDYYRPVEAAPQEDDIGGGYLTPETKDGFHVLGTSFEGVNDPEGDWQALSQGDLETNLAALGKANPKASVTGLVEIRHHV